MTGKERVVDLINRYEEAKEAYWEAHEDPTEGDRLLDPYYEAEAALCQALREKTRVGADHVVLYKDKGYCLDGKGRVRTFTVIDVVESLEG